MTGQVCLGNYRSSYKKNLNDKIENDELKPSTVRQEKCYIDEVVEYFSYEDKYLYTGDFYKSVDNLKDFFDQTNLHGSKVASIRNFLNFIEQDLPERDAEKLRDVRERIKPSRLGVESRSEKSKKKKLEEKILEKEELDAVYAVASVKEDLIIRMMLDMGTRPGELGALTPEDINFDISQGEIEATVKIHKTYSQQEGVLDSPKTEDSNRTVNLRSNTVEKLQAYIEDQGVDRDELIFDGYSEVYESIKDVFTFAHVKIGSNGITDFSPHSLRHNTATRLIVEDGYPKEEVQRYLGHSSVNVTEIYEHFKEDEVIGIYS